MTAGPPVLVAPDTFGGRLRAPVVAAAIGRGLERAGISPPPDLCPVAGGGPGTADVLLPVLGGETAGAVMLLDDGGTALVERTGSTAATGELVAAAVQEGAKVVVLAAGGSDGIAGEPGDALAAIEAAGGLRGATLVILCETRAAWTASDATDTLRRDPRGLPMTAAGGGLAGALWAQYDARLVAGAGFVLDELDFDARMRAARAVIVGEARLDRGTLAGRVTGEIATRARQAGVPCHAIVAVNALDRFDARILDLQEIAAAAGIAEIEAAAERIAAYL